MNNLHLELNLDKNEEVNEATLTNSFKTKTQAEWVEVFRDSDACVSPVVNMNEAHKHQHNIERKSFIKLPDNSGVIPNMSWLDINPETRSFDLPSVGQHTNEVLDEIGLSKSQIEKFVKNNTVQINDLNPASKL